MACLSPEVSLSFALIRNYIRRSNEVEIGALLRSRAVDWDSFEAFLSFHGIIPFAHQLLDEQSDIVPGPVRAFLKDEYYSGIVRSQRLWNEYLRLHDAFERAGIRDIPIKGIAFMSDIYVERPFRSMKDIDLIIDMSQFPKASGVMEQLGYRKELYGLNESFWLDHLCSMTFRTRRRDTDFLVEFKLCQDFTVRPHNILDGVMERLVISEISGRKLTVLSVEDQLCCLALHHRTFGIGLSLKNTVDTAFLLEKYSGKLDWDFVTRQAKRSGLCSCLAFILLRAADFFNSPVPEGLFIDLGIRERDRGRLLDFSRREAVCLSRDHVFLLQAHFMMHDRKKEPLLYLLRMPLEQFARFYDMSPYAFKTKLLYFIRFFYIPARYFACSLIRAV